MRENIDRYLECVEVVENLIILLKVVRLQQLNYATLQEAKYVSKETTNPWKFQSSKGYKGNICVLFFY